MKVQLLRATAILPARQSEQAAGFDLHSDDFVYIPPQGRAVVKTGVAVELMPNTFGRIAPRSGIAVKHGIDVLAGVIDADYRGEILVCLINHGDKPFNIKLGDRVAQLIVQAYIPAKISVVDSLTETERGTGGFGSTGLR